VIINENLVRSDAFTVVRSTTVLGDARIHSASDKCDEITRDIPGLSDDDLANLDEHGVVCVGTFVNPGDILIGRVSPKAIDEARTRVDDLLEAIFQANAGITKHVKPTPIVCPAGVCGAVTGVRITEQDADHQRVTTTCSDDYLIDERYRQRLRAINDRKDRLLALAVTSVQKAIIRSWARKAIKRDQEALKTERTLTTQHLDPGVLKVVEVTISSRHNIEVGDKVAIRHGNKVVIAKVARQEDMPFLANGTPVDIVLNAFGIISRMNMGQIYESHLGLAAKTLGYYVATPSMAGAAEETIMAQLTEAGYAVDGRQQLFDGKTGQPFARRSHVGITYFMKLIHMVEDKIHMRSIGPYSLITQQPLGGKAQFGGQRFGEMEVWALEGYGAAHTLQEMLTIKSDDVLGRAKTYEAIVNGEEITAPHLPESFKVLLAEMKGLGLNVELIER